MKKLIKLFAVVIAVIISNSVFAYDFEVDGIYYNKRSDSTVAVTYKNSNGNSYSGDVTIPSSVTYDETTYNVTSIGGYAFYKCTSLTSITIPNNVTFIGSSAFSSCTGLTNITIPDSVVTIGDYAFAGCSSLTNITINSKKLGKSTNEGIGMRIFSQCTNIQKIVYNVPSGSDANFGFYRKEWLGKWEYKYYYGTWLDDVDNIDTLVIGSDVTYIPNYCFYNKTNIKQIISYATTPPSIGGKGLEVSDSVITTVPCGSAYLYRATGSWGYRINNGKTIDTLNGIKYKEIKGGGVAVLANNYSGKIVIPETITKWDCDFTVTEIDTSAFANCSELTSVTLPNTITTIGRNAFYNSSLTSITLPDSLMSIGNSAFANCSELTSVKFSENLQTIGDSAFANCTELQKEITLPNTVTSIGLYAFGGCEIKTVKIGTGISSIGVAAFMNCYYLDTLYVMSKNAPTLGGSAFSNTNLQCIYVPCGRLNSYKNAENWNSYLYKDKIQEYCKENVTVDTTVAICKGSSYEFNGKTLTQAGTYTTKFVEFGYDSTVNLTLTVNPTYNETVYDTTVLYNQEGEDYYDTVTLNLQTIFGCDSIVTNITYYKHIDTVVIVTKNISAEICDNSVYDFNGKELSVAGIYYDTVHVNELKDSIVILTLTVNPTYNETVEKTVTAVGDNEDYDETTTQTYQTVNGCDSVVTTIIHYKFVEDTSQAGTTITVNGNTYTTDGNTATITDGSGSGNVVIPATITDDEGNTVTVTSIGGGAFKGNKDITSVTIPATITSIDCEAFADCPNLDTIIMQGSNPPVVCETTFGSTKTKAGITVVVPCGAGDNYKNAPVWKDMNIVEDCGESGIEDVNGNASINIYPNPAKDVITLDIEHLTLNNADAVVIFNTAGQVVYKSNIQNQISQIDVSSLKNGVYYIKVGNTTKKLIIK